MVIFINNIFWAMCLSVSAVISDMNAKYDEIR